MINQSVLPFYNSREYQHRNRLWFATGLVPVVVAPLNFLPKFQIIRRANLGGSLTFNIKNLNTNTVTDITTQVTGSGLLVDSTYDYEVIIYSATLQIGGSFVMGEYELQVTDGVNTWYSEFFGMSDNTSDMIRLDFWHLEDFEFDQDDSLNPQYIRYLAPFKNTLYANTELTKPDYPYFREVEQKLGRSFDKVHISWKEFKFSIHATEDVVDAIRLIPLHDKKELIFKGRRFVIDQLLITPTWEEQGDVADIEFVFRTNTVSVTAGRSVLTAAYEPEAGSCLILAHNCVGVLTEGSADYLAFQYLDQDGLTQPLVDGDKVLVYINPFTARVYSYNSGIYTLETTNATDVVFVNSDGLYYTGVGGNNVLLPSIQYYDSDITFAISGPFLNGATHNLYAIIGVSEIFVGSYSYTDLVIDGIAIALPPGTERIRIDIASAACGIFQSTNEYLITSPGGDDEGIGFDVIGTAAIG